MRGYCDLRKTAALGLSSERPFFLFWPRRGHGPGAGWRKEEGKMKGLSRQEERNLIRRAMAENGLRLTVFGQSYFSNGALVEEILYTGRSDEEEVVASGTCLAEALESIEKWRKGRFIEGT